MWPDTARTITARELQWLLDGLALEQREVHPPVQAPRRAVSAAPSKLLPDNFAPIRYPRRLFVKAGKEDLPHEKHTIGMNRLPHCSAYITDFEKEPITIVHPLRGV